MVTRGVFYRGRKIRCVSTFELKIINTLADVAREKLTSPEVTKKHVNYGHGHVSSTVYKKVFFRLLLILW